MAQIREKAGSPPRDGDNHLGPRRAPTLERQALGPKEVIDAFSSRNDLGIEAENAQRQNGPPEAANRNLNGTDAETKYEQPPDGGLSGWLACCSGHIVIMNTWGFILSFGVFQTYYAESLSRSPSDISWIGSLQIWLLFFLGTFTGRLADAGFFRSMLVCGTIFTIVGIFTTSIATKYWHYLLSQGLCMGIGSGCLFTPTLSTVSTYFSVKRHLALGLAACGSFTGGLIFPAMARTLLPSIGLAASIRAIGYVQIATLALANVAIKSRLPPRKGGALVEWAAFKDLGYTFYAIGMFFNFWGVYAAFYYLPSFARTSVIPVLSYVDSLNLLLVMNGTSVIGRLGPNYLADRFGPLNLLAPACLLSGVAVLAWMAVDTPPKLYVWAAFYGIFSGAIQNLFPAGLSSLTADPQRQGTRMGMVFTIVSFAVLTGNPIAGSLITIMDGKFIGAQCFAGASLLVGMVFIWAARSIRHPGRRRNQKAGD